MPWLPEANRHAANMAALSMAGSASRKDVQWQQTGLNSICMAFIRIGANKVVDSLLSAMSNFL